MTKSLLVLFALAAASSAMYDSWDAIPVSETKAPETNFAEESVQSLNQEVAHLRDVSQMHMALHVDRIARHAQLIQGASTSDQETAEQKRSKAYSHNFNRSKNAIRSALKALTAQLNAGHRHDSAALRGERGRGNKVISSTQNKGRSKCSNYRHKACPTKRLEREANARKEAARRSMNNQGNGKVCSGGLGTTFGDMDVEKNVPKFGTELRNKWNRARALYLKNRGKFNAAAKAHRAANAKHNAAMAKFKTALRIEVANAVSACRNAHKEYEALKREVASNVGSRKQVFISTLLITCYVDNITSNASAKACADRKRRASTSQWNINGGSLSRCPSKAHLTNSFGPAGWKPSSRSCHLKHWHEAAHKKKLEREKKERAKKEKAGKAERAKKERSRKERAQKEKNAKQRERESKRVAQIERNGKEQQAKHHQRRERADKAKIERRNKQTCKVTLYEHVHYRGYVVHSRSYCSAHRIDVRLGTAGRRRGYQASSVRLSSGCRMVQLWDEDYNHYGARDNRNLHSSWGAFSYDLNDDVSGYSVWSKCRL